MESAEDRAANWSLSSLWTKVNAYINWGKYYAEQVQGEVIDETLEEDAENKKKKNHQQFFIGRVSDEFL